MGIVSPRDKLSATAPTNCEIVSLQENCLVSPQGLTVKGGFKLNLNEVSKRFKEGIEEIKSFLEHHQSPSTNF